VIDLDIRHPHLNDVVADEPLQHVAGGFLFTEGPVWHPLEGHLTFNDIPGSATFRLDASGTVSTLRSPTNKANGNAYDRQGRLVSCEHASSRVVRLEDDGGVTVLAERFEGKELNSPNDVVVASDGSLYFTDPVYGRTMEWVGLLREPELSVRGVYRFDAQSQELTLVADDFDGPNGLCFSLDERFLFVNDSEHTHVRRLRLEDGRAVDSELWATPTGAGEGIVDGLKIDSAGNIYCTGPGGVHVFDPDGRCLGVILVPEVVGNFTWGDADLRTLYLCATSSVYTCRTKIPGLPAF
jgi:gluconolactonase